MLKSLRKRLDVSVIVAVYNMQREIVRTLYSLSEKYQQGIDGSNYEVIIVDNGSNEPLPEHLVSSFGSNFHYHYIENATPSPVKGLNQAVQKARGQHVLCCIDGARILSPNILSYGLQASKLHESPFIYTLGMHIGYKPQNLSIIEGYNQQVEDELLTTVDWQANGYKLFEVSSVALSSRQGYFSAFSESNAFMLRKQDFLRLGGFDERFQSPGGGLVNLDFFNLVHETSYFQPILLLGEATFHQFHGGVATNVKMEEHPWEHMETEYRGIRGKGFVSTWYPPLYFGKMRPEAKRLFAGDQE